MSPEEAKELDVKVAVSGMTKQDYITHSLLEHEIRIVGGRKVIRALREELEAVLEELQFMDDELRDMDYENNIAVPLKAVLEVLHAEGGEQV